VYTPIKPRERSNRKKPAIVRSLGTCEPIESIERRITRHFSVSLSPFIPSGGFISNTEMQHLFRMLFLSNIFASMIRDVQRETEKTHPFSRSRVISEWNARRFSPKTAKCQISSRSKSNFRREDVGESRDINLQSEVENV